MNFETIKEEGYEYVEVGEGPVIVLLHGLMGGLDNFESIIPELAKNGYTVIGPMLPLFEKPILKTNIKHFSEYIHGFLEFKKLNNVFLFGNSLGGHISLVFAKNYPEMVKGLILTGSSGLYENSMGDSFPRRGDYDYIRTKTEEVFYDPKMATKSLVDNVFEIANDRNSVIRLLTMAKSAIRHNMSNDIPNLEFPVCLIWGKNDNVTPPHVAKEFHKLFQKSELHWIDKCGHSAMWEHPEEFATILLKWLDVKAK
ncbi:alpha/beta hydrolase [Flavobacteriales bacterium]|jgi:2-hydroxy-6-oxonona-2,4-dienedioate hydrolase|nr:alpha/beta hydrolase [Flavobacteriales bacterium]